MDRCIARILSLAATSLLLLSCGGDKQEVWIKVSLAEESVPAEPAGTVYVRVNSDYDWTLSLEGAPDWARLQTTSGSGNRNSIVLSYDANDGESARSLKVVAVAKSSDGSFASAYATLVQDAPKSAENPSGDYSGGGIAHAAPFGWLELPATSASDAYDFLWHTIDVSGKTVRNFSCYWDYSNLVSIWVAYPLNSFYMSGTSWEYAWYDTWAGGKWRDGIDPLLPEDKQSVLSRGGYSGGNAPAGLFYARGHQIARADRRVTKEASDQTCYGINMTPQLNESGNSGLDFNGGIWSSLEGKVRTWASSSDTLYVVTGCVLKGSTDKTKENLGKNVTVPTAYYKAVLRYSPKSTLGYAGYMGCAVWLDHKAMSKSAKVDKSYSMSIDALESKLGFDLFVNLPAKVGEETAAKIEAEDPKTINWWW